MLWKNNGLQKLMRNSVSEEIVIMCLFLDVGGLLCFPIFFDDACNTQHHYKKCVTALIIFGENFIFLFGKWTKKYNIKVRYFDIIVFSPFEFFCKLKFFISFCSWCYFCCFKRSCWITKKNSFYRSEEFFLIQHRIVFLPLFFCVQ